MGKQSRGKRERRSGRSECPESLTFRQLMAQGTAREFGPHCDIVVAELYRQFGHQLKPGGCYEALVLHDGGCGIYRGKICNCEPTVQLIDHTPEGAS
jgi:hypothetical protein